MACQRTALHAGALGLAVLAVPAQAGTRTTADVLYSENPQERAFQESAGYSDAVILRDGRFFVFSESRSIRPGVTVGLIFRSDPAEPGAKAVSFAYQPPQGYRITDIAQLPSGRLVALHRRFNLAEGVSAKIALIETDEIKPKALVRPRVIATLRPPLPVDNMEGIAVDREGQRTILWVIADDNYLLLQRSLLLKFELSEPPSSPRS